MASATKAIRVGRYQNWLGADTSDKAHIVQLRGRAEILALRRLLVQFCAGSEQLGAMDYLEYFLTTVDNVKKIPHLLLVTHGFEVNPERLKVHDLLGAVLVFEYTFFEIPLGVFNTSDFDGLRAVVAAPNVRAAVAATACRFLMEQGAWISLLTSEKRPQEEFQRFIELSGPGKGFSWTVQHREVGATIVLRSTVDETLASMGKHTRRNLRYYRRKAEAEFNCSFEHDVKSTLTRGQMVELNAHSTHPVADVVLEARSRALETMHGLFCVGLRHENGEWISLLGGRRHHGVTEIDWQMNRAGLDKCSVGTALRAHLIEYEISIGSRELFFEGGTPHSMKNSFAHAQVTDLVAVRSQYVRRLLRLTALLLPALKKNFVVQALVNPELHWTAR